MKRIIRNSFLIIIGLILLGLLIIALENLREANSRDRKYVSGTLSKTEKSLIDEALWLKKSSGNQVWPGLAQADIPIILFNDRYEFLVGMENPPSNWSEVKNNTFDGGIYYRKPANNPKIFAIKVGNKWAGSLGTPDRMNREYYMSIRSKLPPVFAQLFPYQYATITPDIHVVGILQEVFHAYQATEAPEHFKSATENYSAEKDYPYTDKNISGYWNKEGGYLWKALNSENTDSVRANVRHFLNVRKERRIKSGMSKQQIHFEQEIEWLDGLAKYSEYKFYKLANVRREKPVLVHYRQTIPQFIYDSNMLKGNLGEQHTDYRFYISGMAQARILDRLNPDWKNYAFQDTTSLESLLHSTVLQ